MHTLQWDKKDQTMWEVHLVRGQTLVTARVSEYEDTGEWFWDAKFQEKFNGLNVVASGISETLAEAETLIREQFSTIVTNLENLTTKLRASVPASGMTSVEFIREALEELPLSTIEDIASALYRKEPLGEIIFEALMVYWERTEEGEKS